MSTNWQIGDRIQNRWEIHRILRGGMGIVYVVYDREWREAFAAKTFQDAVFDRNPLIAQRFTNEALTWINLDIHYNVTQARLVENIEGKPYLFLEYVSGGDLSSWIGTSRLTQDLQQVVRFAIHFCDGMTHALSKGIKAHRDIKPQNCLITHDSILKVTDFGLAKTFDDIGLEGEIGNVQRLSVAMTRTGMGAGTPTHMAPEQFDDAKRVDVRADIYSFGVMLYEMVTGRLPFVGRSWQEFERCHKQERSPSLRKDWPEVSGIVERCLAKEAKDRYEGFEKMREELAGVYEGLTGKGAPKLVNGLDLGALEWNNKGTALSKLGKSDEAMVCYDRAIEISTREEMVWSNKGQLLTELGRFEESVDCHDRALEINPRNENEWYNKGVALGKLGRVEEAMACYDRALEINPRYENAWNNRGATLVKLGRIEEAMACFGYALEINPRDETAWFNKGQSLIELGRLEDATACLDRVLEINPGNTKAWTNQGTALAKLRRVEEAMTCFDRALEINPLDEKAWFNKGAALANSRRLREALPCFEEAHRLGDLQAAQVITRLRQALGQQ